MAKELCMIQRTDRGKEARQYFLQIEKAWNSPEQTIARALRFADAQTKQLQIQNAALTETVSVQTQQIAELQPKASYYDLILQCTGVIPVTVIAKDYGKSAKWMNTLLCDIGVQYKVHNTWVLYQKYAELGYTQTKTHNFVHNKTGEPDSSVHTYWTQKGRLFLYDALKSHGVLPLIERREAAEPA